MHLVHGCVYFREVVISLYQAYLLVIEETKTEMREDNV